MLKIRYSIRARQEELALLEYLVENFGRKKAKEVYDRIEKVLDEISKMPELFPASKKIKNVRKCVLSKQTSIYYRVVGEYIEVITFRANRRDPGKFNI